MSVLLYLYIKLFEYTSLLITVIDNKVVDLFIFQSLF